MPIVLYTDHEFPVGSIADALGVIAKLYGADKMAPLEKEAADVYA